MEYLLLILTVGLLFIKQKNKSNKNCEIGLILSFVVLLILCGFREYIFNYISIGVDYNSYKEWFYNVKEIVKLKDSGFNLLILIIKSIINNHIILFIVTSFIINYCFYKFCKENSCDYKYSIFVYISFGILALSLNIVRQYIACGIFLLAFKFINQEKSFFKYAMYILIAGLFHTSALILLVLYPILNINVKLIYRIIVLVVLAILLTNEYIIYFIMDKFSLIDEVYFSRYWGTENVSATNYTVFSVAIINLIIVLFSYNRFKETPNYNVKVNYLLLLVFFSFIAPTHLIYSRTIHYFMPAILLTIPEVFELFSGKSRKIVKIVTTSLLILMFLM